MKVGAIFCGVLFLIANNYLHGMKHDEINHDELCSYLYPDKDIYLERMCRATNRNNTVAYVYKDGSLKALFDGERGRAKIFINDDAYCEMHFIPLYNLLTRTENPQQYLCEGLVYDARGRVVDDVSIESPQDTNNEPLDTKKAKKVRALFNKCYNAGKTCLLFLK